MDPAPLPSNTALPVPTPAAELNRFLFAARALDVGKGADSDSVLRLVAASNFGGRIVDHTRTLAFVQALGLIQREGNWLQLTRRGQRFLSHNADETYELTVEQQGFLNEECIGASSYSQVITDVLLAFQLDSEGGLAAPPWEYRRPSELSINLFGFLRETGFLIGAGNTLRVAPNAQPEAARLRSTTAISLIELQAILEGRTRRGAAAERWVTAYERRRLSLLGCVAEADAVRVISDLNVCAGYDIESFNGVARPFLYDRFIEVKSTTLGTTEFIWSRNEIEVARSLQGRYWIYLLTSYKEDDTHDLIVIPNPAHELRIGGSIALEPLTYRAIFDEARLRTTL